jgi:imidazoleglycerol-phosphate dehydratase
MNRKATIKRETKETTIRVELSLDGSGESDMKTGVRMLDHMLDQLARHGVFDLKVSANGSDIHHVVEDVAICLGKAFSKALGERAGIARMGWAVVPMDDALAMVAVDLGGRGYAVIDASFAHLAIGEMPAELVRHFLVSLASEARMNLHARVMSGDNDHHKAEVLFKALARALDSACRIDPRLQGRIPSTKEVIEG